jgi:glycosyltransferase involved in cell wall biosynthesis
MWINLIYLGIKLLLKKIRASFSMKIGITCYPTYGGSGVVATELGKALASKGHQVHFISYAVPHRLTNFVENIYFHEVEISNYPLFEFQLYTLALTSKIIEVVKYEKLDLITFTMQFLML